MNNPHELDEAFQWCASLLGPFEILTDESQQHAGQRASTYRLRTSQYHCFLKFHRDPAHWENEVHAYERWAPYFGRFAPRLLAAREQLPLALVITEQPGASMARAQLSEEQARAAWRSAGQALAGLHHAAEGTFFGPCRRDGSSASRTPLSDAVNPDAVNPDAVNPDAVNPDAVDPDAVDPDAVAYISNEFDNILERGMRIGCLRQNELAILRTARQLIPAFYGERPRPCHRDYCPPNWLVENGAWSGVIDFEFSYWDVPSADLSRFPDWNWKLQPGRYSAFLEGVGFANSARNEQQLLVSQTLYALGAIVWGMENEYFVFAREGRTALRHLGKRLA